MVSTSQLASLESLNMELFLTNFDQNEDTLDGKCTTHAMASVVFRRGQVSTADKCLARVPQRSLTTLNPFDMDGDKLYRYLLLKNVSEIYFYVVFVFML